MSAGAVTSSTPTRLLPISHFSNNTGLANSPLWRLPIPVIHLICKYTQGKNINALHAVCKDFKEIASHLGLLRRIVTELEIPLKREDDDKMLRAFISMHWIAVAAFERCYVIELSTPPAIKLRSSHTLEDAHRFLDQKLGRLTSIYGDHLFLHQLRKTVVQGPVKYPEYFRTIEVLKVALKTLPPGSWAIHSTQECLKQALIWKGAINKVEHLFFMENSELRSVQESVMKPAQKVEIGKA